MTSYLDYIFVKANLPVCTQLSKVKSYYTIQPGFLPLS